MRRLSLIVLSMLLLAGGCKLFSPVEYSTDITINGKALDQTGAPVAGVTAVLTGASGTQTATTDQYGVYHFTGAKAGKYSISFEKAGYARVNSAQLTIDNASSLVGDLNLTTYSYTENLDVVMYEETASLRGAVYYMDKYDQRPAVGAKVKAYFTYGAISGGKLTKVSLPIAIGDPARSDEAYEAIVGTDGTFSFSAANATPNGLPRASGISVYVEQFVVGTGANAIAYEGVEPIESPFDLSAKGGDAFVSVTLDPLAAQPLLLTTGLGSAFVPNADTITLNFSRAIEPALSSFSLWDTETTPAEYCVLNPTWAADYMSVVLKPAEELALGYTYTLHYAIEDASGYSAGHDPLALLSLKTAPKIALVSSNVDPAYATATFGGLAELPIAGDIVFNFNVDVAKVRNISLTSSYDAELRSFASPLIGVADQRVVTLNPGTDLKPGIEYKVSIEAISGNLAEDKDAEVFTKSFFSSSAVTFAAATKFQLSSPATVNYDTATPIVFTFIEPAYAKRFEVQARYYKVGVTTTAWQSVGTADSVNKDYYDQTKALPNSITATLAAPYFDPYDDDAIVTPFVGTHWIEFRLLSFDAKGNSLPSVLRNSIDTLDLAYIADTVRPSASSMTASVVLPAGPRGTDLTVTFTVSGVDEYIQMPTATFVGFTGTAVPISSAYTWSTLNSPKDFTFSVTFPTNCTLNSGNSVRVTLADLAGNNSAVEYFVEVP